MMLAPTNFQIWDSMNPAPSGTLEGRMYGWNKNAMDDRRLRGKQYSYGKKRGHSTWMKLFGLWLYEGSQGGGGGQKSVASHLLERFVRAPLSGSLRKFPRGLGQFLPNISPEP